MIEPGRPSATSARATRWVHTITWRRLARYRASNPFSDVSRNGARNTPPALLTRMSTGPSSATVAARASSTCWVSRTSTVSPRLVPPAAAISAAAAAEVSASRSQMATAAP